MTEKRKSPALRFRGYTDDWEQRKLDDMCEIITKQTGFDYSATIKPSLLTESSNETYSFIQNKDFSGNEINLDTDFFIPIEVAERFPKILLDKPSLLISISGRIGNVGFYNLPQKSFIGGAVGICKLKNSQYGEFIVQELESDYGENYFHSLIKASSHANITVEDIRNINILMPKDDCEQEKIASYFNNLDNLITLHQRKLEKLKLVKKSMLEKMFPKNGSSVPEIRFNGFTDDWEQRKFSELYARSSEKNDGSIGMDKNITVATMQFKNDVKVSTTEYLKTYYTFKLGDIAFEGHQSKEFRYGRFVENDIGNGIVSHIFAVFRPIQEYDLCFWKYAINNETLMQRILARSTKASTMMHDLVTNDFLKETFLVPSVKEQKQIGAFLNKLDNLITLHQRKVEKLQIMKKSMLEKMFV